MVRLSLYGNVGMLRTFCQDCQRMTLVIDNIRQCCNRDDDGIIAGTERIVEPEYIKRSPSRTERIKILRRQHERCLYCGRRLGSLVWYKGKQIFLRVNYDHVLPFEYACDNSLGNFVAACHVCNHWKSDLIFNHLEEIQIYVTEKWQRVETDVGKNLPGMRGGIPN